LKSLRSPAHVRLLQLLVTAREKAGLTQQQLADRLRKPQSFISKYEGGERRIDVIEFIAIAEALEMDASRAIRDIRAKFRA
jgi:transcriptional regulator with XRE-family HTH domain